MKIESGKYEIRKFYIALQDGKYSNKEYESYLEAMKDWEELPENTRNTTCVKISSYENKL